MEAPKAFLQTQCQTEAQYINWTKSGASLLVVQCGIYGSSHSCPPHLCDSDREL